MSNVNLAATAAIAKYEVSITQMAQLIAENLNVPVAAVTINYVLADHDYDGPGRCPQFVSKIEVTVNNQIVERLKQAGLRRHDQGRD